MDATIGIVADLSVVMLAAALVTYLFHLLKQPPILGYLVAGMIIGPYTPPFSLLTQREAIELMAELGVILLLFGIGLELPVRRLRSVGKVSVGVACIEIAVMYTLSYIAGIVFGWSFIEILFIGTALASSSTTIIAKILTDMRVTKDISSTIMLGILIIEDLFVVYMIGILENITVHDVLAPPQVAFGVLRTILFVGGTLVIGPLLVPRLVDLIHRRGSDELTLVIALGLCFAMSVLSINMGFSMSIGAFLMGVLIASSRASDDVARLTSPIKDMFGAIFFVSMGALLDVSLFPIFLVPSLVVTLLTIGGKFVGCGLGTRLFGYRYPIYLRVGLGMVQTGEFAFIVLKKGLDLGAIDPHIFPMVGVATALTSLITPYLIRRGFELK